MLFMNTMFVYVFVIESVYEVSQTVLSLFIHFEFFCIQN